MKIEIAVEGKNNTVFDWNISNFPGRFTFLDRTSKVLIEVNIDLEAFEILMKQIERKVKVIKVIPAFIPHEDIHGEAEIYEKDASME